MKRLRKQNREQSWKTDWWAIEVMKSRLVIKVLIAYVTCVYDRQDIKYFLIEFPRNLLKIIRFLVKKRVKASFIQYSFSTLFQPSLGYIAYFTFPLIRQRGLEEGT